MTLGPCLELGRILRCNCAYNCEKYEVLCWGFWIGVDDAALLSSTIFCCCFRWGGLLLPISLLLRNNFNAFHVCARVAADHVFGGTKSPVLVEVVNDCECTVSPVLLACMQRKYDILMMAHIHIYSDPET